MNECHHINIFISELLTY